MAACVCVCACLLAVKIIFSKFGNMQLQFTETNFEFGIFLAV